MTIWTRKTAVLFAFCLFPVSGKALRNDSELPLNLVSSLPLIIEEEGRAVEAWFDDGRVAELRLQKLESKYLATTFEFTGSTCGFQGILGWSGEYQVGVQGLRFAWFWKRHFNPERVGRVLEVKENNESTSEFKPFYSEEPALFGILDRGAHGTSVPRDRITLPQSLFPQSILIQTWLTEIMLENPETGLSENLVVLQADRVELEQVRVVEYKVQRMGDWRKIEYEVRLAGEWQRFTNLPGYLVAGQSIQWVLGKENGQNCLLSWKPDIQFIQNQVFDYLQTSPVVDEFVFFYIRQMSSQLVYPYSEMSASWYNYGGNIR